MYNDFFYIYIYKSASSYLRNEQQFLKEVKLTFSFDKFGVEIR